MGWRCHVEVFGMAEKKNAYEWFIGCADPPTHGKRRKLVPPFSLRNATRFTRRNFCQKEVVGRYS
jgi:hypothetical protein